MEGKAETKYLKRMRRLGGRSHKSRKMAKEEHEVPESSTRGNLGLRAQVKPDPAELTGGEAPPCAEPPVAPTLFGPHFSSEARLS